MLAYRLRLLHVFISKRLLREKLLYLTLIETVVQIFKYHPLFTLLFLKKPALVAKQRCFFNRFLQPLPHSLRHTSRIVLATARLLRNSFRQSLRANPQQYAFSVYRKNHCARWAKRGSPLAGRSSEILYSFLAVSECSNLKKKSIEKRITLKRSNPVRKSFWVTEEHLFEQLISWTAVSAYYRTIVSCLRLNLKQKRL